MYHDLQLDQTSTVDRAADEIRRAIFAGRLEPGARLREVALSAAMGVGRSTIRESLAVLVADGVAVRVPHRGVTVKELSPDDVSDISLARAALELAGVRRWTRATDQQRAVVRVAVDAYTALARRTKDPGALTEAHLRIHQALVGLTGSQRLVATARSYGAELRLGLAHLDRVRSNITEQVEGHRILMRMLEDGDIEAAADELSHHLTSAEVSLNAAIRHGTIGT